MTDGTQTPRRVRVFAEPTIEEVVDVADVWSGHPVRFALCTHGDHQFVAYYDRQRRMTVAKRRLGTGSHGGVWEKSSLPSVVGWDSHNYISMALDAAGHVHVSGNMHYDPLVYFRTAIPGDIDSFERQAAMVGSNEQTCTYPEFFYGPSGELMFSYRDGGSGKGDTIFNTFDTAKRAWRRLFGGPIVDGEGVRNIYPVGPLLGPDGFWHLVWTWRDTPDAHSNHDLSYARSRDLSTWERGDGTPLMLPITLDTAEIVDPVPVGGGMINGNTVVGFDGENRPVIAYHKFDESGFTQLHNARFEAGGWRIYRVSDWDYRWDFGGRGSLVFEITLEGVRAVGDGRLRQGWYHARMGGHGAFELNQEDLSIVGRVDPQLPYPQSLDVPQTQTPKMRVRWQHDSGREPAPGIRYMLRWETLEANRDRPRAESPSPTRLRVYGFGL